jgi:hypothetical protein
MLKLNQLSLKIGQIMDNYFINNNGLFDEIKVTIEVRKVV